MAPIDDAVVLIVHHDVQASAKDFYELWLKEIASEAGRFAGHLGVNIIRPHSQSQRYTIVLRFDSAEHLESWLASETRHRYIDEVRPALLKEEEVAVETGMEYWFTPPVSNQLHAKPFKQFLITLSAIFPLTIIVPLLLEPVQQVAPLLGAPIISNFIVAVVIVYLMVYVIMPRYTKRVAKWLFS